MREPRSSHFAGMATLVLFIACNRGEHGSTARRRNEPQPLVRKECSGGSAQNVDVNNDGRPDIVHRLNGSKRVCSEIDMNFDGKPDLLRFYEDDGKTVAFEQHDFDFDGRIDDQGYFQNGALARKELDTNFDGLVDTWMWCKGPLVERAERARRKPGRVDTWEAYQNGLLAEVEYDENNDGEVEKWDAYRQGVLYETRVDTTGDGKPDRTERAVAGGNEQDERVSCDGTALPPLAAPPPPTPVSAPAAPGAVPPAAGVAPGAYDGAVPRGVDLGLRGAAKVDPELARDIALGVNPDGGPILGRGDAGR